MRSFFCFGALLLSTSYHFFHIHLNYFITGMVSPCHVVSSVSAWIFPQITCCYFCSSFSHAASGGWVNWKLVGGAGNGNLPCHVGTPQLLLYRLLQLRSLDDTIIFVLFLDGLVKIKAACVFLYFSLVLNVPSQHYWFPVKKSVWWFELMACALFCEAMRFWRNRKFVIMKWHVFLLRVHRKS